VRSLLRRANESERMGEVELRLPLLRALAESWLAQRDVVAAQREALLEIAKGEGPFSRDPLTHAENTIEAMKELAAVAAVVSGTEK
jgi:hypothetical protein